ncbi:unnamed protein product [Penicillium olsonii]|nr:unnamed protein product [Penicillium olsonii]CAG7932518.1 unnamed protein product [Penicillium olsonii]
MGAGNSKPEATASSQHVFSSNSPVQFSSNLVDALQSNSESDSTRAKALELEIQNRVAQELQRLREREQQTLAQIEKRLAESKDTTTLPIIAATAPLAAGHPEGSLNLDAPRIPFAGRHHDPVPTYAAPAEAAAPAQPAKRDVSRDSVAAEIDQLRSKLDGRRKLTELDGDVAKARADVTSCLQLNDRRPLNCWEEVDAFKREVARMEASFVDRIVG